MPIPALTRYFWIALAVNLFSITRIGAAEPPAVALTVSRTLPHEAIWPETFTANGVIAAWQEAIVGSQLAGLAIVTVKADIGDQVKKGQVLAELNDALLLADRDQLQAELAQVEANVRQAEANRQRALSLKTSGSMSEQNTHQLIAQADALKAQASAVKAKLHTNSLQLSYSKILAPDDGVITSRTANLGAVVGNGTELFRLIRQNKLEWRGEVTAEQLNKINPGQLVQLQLADGSQAKAQVRMLAPHLDAQTRLGKVYADVVAGSTAKAGMYVTGQVQTSQNAALAIPAASLVIHDGKSYVVKFANADPISQVRLQRVIPGRRQGREVEITQGISKSDLLVEDGAGFLNDGDWVRVAEPTAPNAPAGQ